jgi:polysaccharide biosynthesis protein PslJ
MTTLATRRERTLEASQRASRESRHIVSVLSLYALLRIVLPSQYVIGPLGGAGQPAQLLGLGITLWWLTDWLGRPWSGSRVGQPLKRFAFLFLVAVLASYLVASLRPLSSAEQLAADRSVLNVIAWIGVTLTAMDGITTRAELDTLLRRVTLLGGLEGALGIVQLLARQSFIQYFQLPGLSNTGVDPLLLSRGSFLRPVGTAISPIEYGVFLAMMLPIALHYAISDAGRRAFLARWLPVGAIACALSLSLSRSAIVSTALSLVVLLPAWPPWLRRRIYLAVPVFVAGAAIALRGFLRTVLNLFGGIGTDSSALSRADSYSVAWSFIARDPVFGRGTGTFLPEYWILDNQFLGSLIEIGAAGIVCMLLLFLSGAVTGWQLGRPMAVPDGRAPATSKLGPTLAAAVAAGSVSFAFFDAFSFPMVPSMLFLMLGCVGALRRLTLEDVEKHSGIESAAGTPTGLPPPNRPVERRAHGTTIWSFANTVGRLWPLAVAGLIATLVGSYLAATAAGVFYEQANVIFIAPNGSGFEAGPSSLVSTAGLVATQLGDQGPVPLSPTATIVGAGIRDGVWVRLPNEGGQWATNFDQENLDVEVVGGRIDQVQAEMDATVAKIRTLLRTDQLSAGARPNQLISIGMSPPSPVVFYMRGSAARAGITVFALGLILTLTSVMVLDRWLARSFVRWAAGRVRDLGEWSPPG